MQNLLSQTDLNYAVRTIRKLYGQSTPEVEDAVQEAAIVVNEKWEANHPNVSQPRQFLVACATKIVLNQINSKRNDLGDDIDDHENELVVTPDFDVSEMDYSLFDQLRQELRTAMLEAETKHDALMIQRAKAMLEALIEMVMTGVLDDTDIAVGGRIGAAVEAARRENMNWSPMTAYANIGKLGETRRHLTQKELHEMVAESSGIGLHTLKKAWPLLVNAARSAGSMDLS